jgi:hypothetical protein
MAYCLWLRIQLGFESVSEAFSQNKSQQISRLLLPVDNRVVR